MRVGFTGTQLGMTSEQKKSFKFVIRGLEPTEFHHGDCIGADAEAHASVRVLSETRIVCHPPVNPKKRAFCACNESRPMLPYLERNQRIVDEIDLLVAAPKEEREQLRSGTWSTVRRANYTNKPVIVIFPSGKIESNQENGLIRLLFSGREGDEEFK